MRAGRRRAAILATCGIAGLSVACTDSQPRDDGSSIAPNVLLISIDTLRADHVGAYGAGDAATPMIDRIAARGVRFATAVSPAPLTLPAHASLFTGLDPPRHGVRHNGIHQLGDDQTTIAERFREAGYQTGAVVAAVVLARDTGIAQGFDDYHDGEFSQGVGSHGYVQRPAREVTDLSIAWLRDARRPYFLWVHYFDPHSEYAPPAPYSDDPDPYAGEIRYVDAEIERLLKAADFPAMLDDTVVALTADHGESLGEHGELTHAYTLYDSSLRIPMLVAGPGVPAGRVFEEVTGLIDLAPTLLKLAGLDPLPGIDGVDRLSQRRSGVYSETVATQLDHGWAPLHSIRTDRYRYVRAPRAEFYDLASDPGETRNLIETASYGSAPEPQRLDAQITAALAQSVDNPARELDASTRGQLAELGYALPEETPESSSIDPKDGLQIIDRLAYAQTAFYAGDIESATASTSELIEQFPGSAVAHSLMGRIHARQNQPEAALREAHRSVELAPDNARFRAHYGNALLGRGQIEAAVAQLRAGIELNPDIELLHFGLLWVEGRAGNLDEAIAHERRLVEIAPNDLSTLAEIGHSWNRLGQPARAYAAFQRAHALDRDPEWLNLELALLAVQLGHPPQAYLAAAATALDSPDARVRLAAAYARAGRVDEALALSERAAAAHPESKSVQQNLTMMRRWASQQRPAPQ